MKWFREWRDWVRERERLKQEQRYAEIAALIQSGIDAGFSALDIAKDVVYHLDFQNKHPEYR